MVSSVGEDKGWVTVAGSAGGGRMSESDEDGGAGSEELSLAGTVFGMISSHTSSGSQPSSPSACLSPDSPTTELCTSIFSLSLSSFFFSSFTLSSSACFTSTFSSSSGLASFS